MGDVVGGITDAIGLTNNKGEKEAAKNAARAADNSYALSKEAIEFQKEQYKDWKAVYGDIQTNLGDYYKNLTPEKIISVGLTNQQKEYQAAVADIGKLTAIKSIPALPGVFGSSISGVILSLNIFAFIFIY